MDKALLAPVEFKSGMDGEFEAVFSTFGVIDKDGDIVKESAIESGLTLPVMWSHEVWERPVGIGKVSKEGNRAIIKGQFIDSTAGRDARATVMATKDIQELSWGFKILESSDETHEGQRVRVIEKTDPHEVSFVLRGAGEGTGIRRVKSSISLIEQVQKTRDAVAELLKRVDARVELRASEGRVISKDAADELSGFAEVIEAAGGQVREILDGYAGSTEAPPADVMLELQRLRGRYLRGESLAS